MLPASIAIARPKKETFLPLSTLSPPPNFLQLSTQGCFWPKLFLLVDPIATFLFPPSFVLQHFLLPLSLPQKNSIRESPCQSQWRATLELCHFLPSCKTLQRFAANIADKELLKCDPPVIVSANTSDDSCTTLVLLHLCILVISSKGSDLFSLVHLCFYFVFLLLSTIVDPTSLFESVST